MTSKHHGSVSLLTSAHHDIFYDPNFISDGLIKIGESPTNRIPIEPNFFFIDSFEEKFYIFLNLITGYENVSFRFSFH